MYMNNNEYVHELSIPQIFNLCQLWLTVRNNRRDTFIFIQLRIDQLAKVENDIV